MMGVGLFVPGELLQLKLKIFSYMVYKHMDKLQRCKR